MSGSSPPQRRPISSARVRNAILINQLATPGLGSLLAGRYLAGAGQLALALAGFGFVVAWFVAVSVDAYRQFAAGAEAASVAWLGGVGALLFGVSWVWALFTSLGLRRQARAAATPPPIPPVPANGAAPRERVPPG